MPATILKLEKSIVKCLKMESNQKELLEHVIKE
jgi:hypothetical protein